jgi:uncharacterized protein (TIGR02266 family)
MSGQNQRKFPRHPLTVEFRSRQSDGLGQLSFDGSNVSAGGAFLKSELLLEEGEALSLEFSVPGHERPFRAQAKVAWVRRFPADGEEAGMGLEFVAMEDHDRQALTQFLSRVASSASR